MFEMKANFIFLLLKIDMAFTMVQISVTFIMLISKTFYSSLGSGGRVGMGDGL